MTITQDYQMEYNGLLMGNDTPYDLVGIIGLGQPAVRELDVDRQDDHGSYPSRRELLQMRTINIEIDVIAADIEDLFNKTSALKRAIVVNNGIRRLDFRIAASGLGAGYGDVVSVYGYVRQVTANIGEQANYSTNKVYIQIRCPDPRVYGLTLQSTEVDVASIAGGWSFPWTFPWTFGTVESGTVIIDNQGNFDTPPVVVFNGPIVNPRISSVNLGRFLGFELSIATGDYLEVNFRDKTALLNGTASRYNNRVFGSSWFPLVPGVNVLQYSAASGSGQAEILWQNAWS